MSNGYGTFWDWYAVAPYQFPLAESFPVVRIPVAGPAPFNTLVVVRTRLSAIGETRHGDGKLRRYTLRVGTGFRLIGHDSRVRPAFQHSTAVSLQMLQADDDTAFTIAVDTVTGDFDDDGNWVLTAQVADAFDNVLAFAGAYASSWVLCHEPPVDPARNPGRPGQVGTRPQSFVASVERTALERPDGSQAPGHLAEPIEPWLAQWGTGAVVPRGPEGFTSGTHGAATPGGPREDDPGLVPCDRATHGGGQATCNCCGCVRSERTRCAYCRGTDKD